LAALALRFAASFVFDLNLMESYGAVMARYPSLSYADHPPLTWWLIGLVTHITGSEAAPVVRAPFIVLFLGTSWLLYGITERLFGARPAFYAAAALTPVAAFRVVGRRARADGRARDLLRTRIGALPRRDSLRGAAKPAGDLDSLALGGTVSLDWRWRPNIRPSSWFQGLSCSFSQAGPPSAAGLSDRNPMRRSWPRRSRCCPF